MLQPPFGEPGLSVKANAQAQKKSPEKKFMMFLLVLVYLCAAACISEKINLDPCWNRDILRIKGQGQITKCYCFNGSLLAKLKKEYSSHATAMKFIG